MADEMTANELDVLATNQTNDQSYDSNVIDDYGYSSNQGIDIEDVLSEQGISDPSRIKFEQPDGSLVERDWNDLSRDEQMNIVKSSAPVKNQLTNDEAAFLNHVRQHGVSPIDYVRSISNAVANSVVQEPTYEIDSLSDDELFILDAIDKYGDDITDDQLETLMANAKSDADLYAMNINSLRNQYSAKEDELKIRQQNIVDAKRAEDFANFRESILDEIQSLQNIAGQEVELSVEDMNDLANYILTKDENGQTQFNREMNDPRMFTRAAFWALKGDDLMNEISSQIRMAYERGVEVGSRGRSQLAFNTKRDNKASSDYMAGDLDVR